MRTKSSAWPAGAFAALWMIACSSAALIAPAAADEAPPTAAAAAALVVEARRAFTLHGKPIPPEILRDMGDGDIADSGGILVTVDAGAAIGSNLYFDDIKQDHGWVSQKKANQSMNGAEETAYHFVGATANGLLVVIATYNGGGTGYFTTLHILDIAAARAFDSDGKIYQRINLTNVRDVALGDRWEGEASIAKNAVTIVTNNTNKKGPVDTGPRATMTINAERP
ncbi:hypothetical protein [Methylocapsa sp. S129]|uniref:hypothetical protein n=1 Tax=Methylocapsa sp. S129 TaxID=1641869 RepID=UPI00131D40FB|nr:hypothetical protein [Methylocapsa sp. S129]